MSALPHGKYKVEAQLSGSVWTDITGDILWRQGITITRGRADEQSTVQPGRAAFSLLDRLGVYGPGAVMDGIAVRITYDTDLPRYYGFLAQVAMSWTPSRPAVIAVVDWSVVDLMARIGERAGSLRPFVVEEMLLDDPHVLMTFGDASTATQAASIGSALTTGQLLNIGGGGTYAFGSGTGPPTDGESALVLTRTNSTSGYFVSCAGIDMFDSAFTLEVWVNTTTGTGTLGQLATISQNPYASGNQVGTMRIVEATGKLQFLADDWGGTPLISLLSPSSVANGVTHHCAVTYTQDGVNHSATLYVDGVQVATGSTPNTWALIVAHYMVIGGSRYGVFGGTLANAALYKTVLSGDRIAAHYEAGWTGGGGERSDERISRLAAYANLRSLTPAYVSGVWVLDSSTLSVLDTTTILITTDLDIDVGQALVYGQATGGRSPLSAMEEVAVTEGGVILADREGFLDFQARDHRYNRGPVLILGLSQLTQDLECVLDTQSVTNDVTATTEDGLTVRTVDATSVADRGTYDTRLDLLTRDQLDAWGAATWLANRSLTPEPRYRQMPVDLMRLSAAQAKQALTVDVGDQILVQGLPSPAPDSAPFLAVEGYAESVTSQGWSLTYNTSSADRYQVWELDSPIYSTLDTTTIPAF